MGENIMYLLDTNILIYYFNGNIPEKNLNRMNNI
jgi:predicted nucleic acid-binding protein